VPGTPTLRTDARVVVAAFTVSGVVHLVPAVLLGVFPGNIKMALDASRSRNQVFQAAAYARLPLQLPLIRGAWRTARSPR
jgi:hypothetical protein